MTLKEFQEIGDCDVCPFMSEGECCGGWKSGAGGTPIEPPCCSWPDDDPDIDMDDLLSRHQAKKMAYERHLDELYEAEMVRKEKAAKRAETRRAMELYCHVERIKVKALKKQIKGLQKQADMAMCLANAFNFANEAFHYKERYQIDPVFKQRIENLELELKDAESAYKNKRKEFYEKRKLEQIK